MGSMQDKVSRKGEEENGSIHIKVEWGAKDDKQQITVKGARQKKHAEIKDGREG